MSDPKDAAPNDAGPHDGGPKNVGDETPIQRALRLKKAAIDAKPKPPRGGKFQREQAAAMATGVSKPWMKR